MKLLDVPAAVAYLIETPTTAVGLSSNPGVVLFFLETRRASLFEYRGERRNHIARESLHIA